MISIKNFIPGIAWFFLVLILVCLPGDNLPKPDNWLSAIYFDKWVHAGLFSILAFLFMLPVCKSDLSGKEKGNLILKIALATCVWGITTEFIQKFFIVGRAFDLLDWVADSAGVLIALLFSRIVYLK